jgi:hypothetical protein
MQKTNDGPLELHCDTRQSPQVQYTSPNLLSFICYKCGNSKSDSIATCANCKTTPNGDRQHIISLLLSHRVHSHEKLSELADDIRSNRKIKIQKSKYMEAESIFRKGHLDSGHQQNPQDSPGVASLNSNPHLQFDNTKDNTNYNDQFKDSCRVITRLHLNPFYYFGASTRDNRSKIVELAEEKSLILDAETCVKYRGVLINPQNRLAAEISWMPGVSPNRANELIRILDTNYKLLTIQSGLQPLAHANLLAACFELIDPECRIDEWVDLIICLSKAVEQVKIEKVIRDINEDRTIAMFPEIRALDSVEKEIIEVYTHYTECVKNALDRIPSSKLIDIVTRTVEKATNRGEVPSPTIIESLINRYEVETTEFLQKEVENIKTILESARKLPELNVNTLNPYIAKLEKVLLIWEKVAKPIKISKRSLGLRDEISFGLASEIRSFAIDIYNENDLYESVQHINRILIRVFSDVPDLLEILKNDTKSLREAILKRTEEKKVAEKNRKEWSEEIAYEANIIGGIYGKNLKISTSGLEWSGKCFPLESITRVRWGEFVRSGVVEYSIYFGDTNDYTSVTFKDEDIYTQFVSRLWKSVGIRLLLQQLAILKEGQCFTIGDSILHDEGVELKENRNSSSANLVYLKWEQLVIYCEDESFIIASSADKKIFSNLPYLEVDNVHILEKSIRMFFKIEGGDRLSDLLNKCD